MKTVKIKFHVNSGKECVFDYETQDGLSKQEIMRNCLIEMFGANKPNDDAVGITKTGSAIFARHVELAVIVEE
jgi:pectate lyase